MLERSCTLILGLVHYNFLIFPFPLTLPEATCSRERNLRREGDCVFEMILKRDNLAWRSFIEVGCNFFWLRLWVWGGRYSPLISYPMLPQLLHQWGGSTKERWMKYSQSSVSRGSLPVDSINRQAKAELGLRLCQCWTLHFLLMTSFSKEHKTGAVCTALIFN